MSQESNQSPNQVNDAAKSGEAQGGEEKAPGKEKAGVEPSGHPGGNPSTAGPGQTVVHSTTPENALGRLNPSAPEDANVTPGSATVK